MVPCLKQGLIHQRRDMLHMKQAVYPQGTTAGCQQVLRSCNFVTLNLGEEWLILRRYSHDLNKDKSGIQTG